MRGEVESLLASDQTAETGMATAVRSVAQSLLVLDGVPDADPLLGARLGPWRVMREIGRGGRAIRRRAIAPRQAKQRRAAVIGDAERDRLLYRVITPSLGQLPAIIRRAGDGPLRRVGRFSAIHP